MAPNVITAPGGHPSLVVSCEYEAFYGNVFEDPDRGNFPLRDGMATFSMDGKRVVKKALGTQQEDGFNTGFIFMPIFSGPILFIDHAVSLEVTPLARDRTQMISEWYVHEDAEEDVRTMTFKPWLKFFIIRIRKIAPSPKEITKASGRRVLLPDPSILSGRK